MKLFTTLGVTSALLATADAGYAPELKPCHADSVKLRSAGLASEGTQKIHPLEAAYAAARRAKAPAALRSYLSHPRNRKAWGGSLAQLTSNTAPVIGVTLSGGGDRAALYDAATLNTLDGRNGSSVEKGLGGILQATTYLSALSGGSWALMSLATNNFPEVWPMVLGENGKGGWLLEEGLSPSNATELAAFEAELLADIKAKHEAGFAVTYGDWWGLELGRHFVGNPTAGHGDSTTFSSVTGLSAYKQHEMPFPIILSEGYSPSLDNVTTYQGSTIPLQSVIYEFTPLEFGSYDPQVAHFIPAEHLGTSMKNGKVDGGKCASNFDNSAFIIGASANLYHEYNVSYPTVFAAGVEPVVSLIEGAVGNQTELEMDTSAVPNPFHGLKSRVEGLPYPDQDQAQLRLVDGGLDDQVDPVTPMGVPARGVDLIIVSDAVADTAEAKPDGASLTATLARQAFLPSGSYNFPPLPKTTDTFIAQGLNLRPTFFGCNATPAKLRGRKHKKAAAYPFMVYLPNYDPTGVTNQTTATTTYSRELATAFLNAADQVGHNGILGADGSADAEWAKCMACAVVERARGKAGVDRTEECGECFERYCWSGVETVVANSTAVEKRAVGGRGHSRDFLM